MKNKIDNFLTSKYDPSYDFVNFNLTYVVRESIDGNEPSISFYEDIRNFVLSLKKVNTIYISILYESPCYSKWKNIVSNIKKQLPSKKVVVIINSTIATSDPDYHNVAVDDVILCHYFLLKDYRRIVVNKESKQSMRWNNNSNKFLFFTGKPNRSHRIGTMYKFYKENYFDKMNWSFFMFDEMRDEAKAQLRQCFDVTDEDFDEFVKASLNDPERINELYTETQHYDGIPYNFRNYDNALFSVVTETGYNPLFGPEYNAVWITEKTWKPIINHLPFIVISSDNNFVKKLRDYGFSTFDYLYNSDEYDSMRYMNFKVPMFFEQVSSMYDNIKRNKQRVQEDVHHNYNLIKTIHDEQMNMLESVIRKNNSKCNPENLINFYKFYDEEKLINYLLF